jgi:capsular polysaccharide biosynthesis protein
MKLSRSRTSVIVAVVLAVLLFAGGIPLALSQPLIWTSRSSVLVLPRSGPAVHTDQLAAFYEALASGQIPETYAEFIRDSDLGTAAESDLGLSTALRRSVKVDAELVPNTSVIQLTVTGPDAQAVEHVATRVAYLAIYRIANLDTPFTSSVVGSGASAAKLTGLGGIKLLGLIVVGVLVVAVGVQQLIQRTRIRKPRQVTPAAAPPAPPVASTPPATGGNGATGANRRNTERRTDAENRANAGNRAKERSTASRDR